jgi:GT2 family glycosyltransferase
MPHDLTASTPITVFIHSYNRPLYLWASLDSLYRGTRHPHRFVFLDMASDDPLVRQVVAGFERRGMFSEVVWSPRGDIDSFWALLWPRLAEVGPFFAYCETDVIVEGTDPCWLTTLAALMQGAPRLAMLGSVIDKHDFVGFDEARRLEPQAEDHRLRDMIKWFSPERAQDPSAVEGSIFSPHNPAGRLLMMRSEALAKVGAGVDAVLHEKFIAAGYEIGIATAVRHRHLSLLHVYDYPQYDYDRRDAYWQGPHGEAGAPPPAACP